MSDEQVTREEAEELALEMCADCKGWIGCQYRDDFDQCDGYRQEVEDILRDENG